MTKKFKKNHKKNVEGLKKLSTIVCMFYDLLHYRRCTFTKFQFFSGGYKRNSFFSTFLTLPDIPGSLGIKIRNCLSFKNYFQRIAIVPPSWNRVKHFFSFEIIQIWKIFPTCMFITSCTFLRQARVVGVIDIYKSAKCGWSALVSDSFDHFQKVTAE